jgi:uncharacterized membrane protein SpoIIM required for sporulation
MVLESLISTKSIIEKPYKIAIHSILGTVVAIIVTTFLGQNGLFLVFLIVLSLLPATISNLKYEERKKEYDHFWDYLYNLNFIYRHSNIIIYYISIIIAVSSTVSFFYLLLPSEISNRIFSNQIATVAQITGSFSSQEMFLKIFINNLIVMCVCFIFSLFYSTGAIFLISWNASVLGIAVGQGAKELFGFASIPLVLFSYLPHGLPEFLGYIFAGIAGGILSVAITRHKESRKHKIFVLKDSLLLFSVGVLFILVGAIIECFLI